MREAPSSRALLSKGEQVQAGHLAQSERGEVGEGVARNYQREEYWTVLHHEVSIARLARRPRPPGPGGEGLLADENGLQVGQVAALEAGGLAEAAGANHQLRQLGETGYADGVAKVLSCFIGKNKVLDEGMDGQSIIHIRNDGPDTAIHEPLTAEMLILFGEESAKARHLPIAQHPLIFDCSFWIIDGSIAHVCGVDAESFVEKMILCIIVVPPPAGTALPYVSFPCTSFWFTGNDCIML